MDDRILRKFENRSIKIALFNAILVTKSIHFELFTLILYGLGSVVILGDFQC